MKKKLLQLCAYRIVIIIFLGFAAVTANSQSGLCPPNLDFEFGDFSHWECKSGFVSSADNNTVGWASTGQDPDRHTIIPGGSTALDPYGSFPISCPNGSGFSIKLGNNNGGHEAEGVFYTYSIPANISRFSIIYNYAIVLQNPNHQEAEQPRFRARIIDLTDNSEIHCVSFDFTASSSLPGFLQSPVAGNVIYKDWTPISVDLSSFIGKTIRLEFITSDCTFTQHFGYAYIDVNSNCNGVISGSTLCEGDTSLLISAPNGFASYTWYSDLGFSSVLSNAQTLFLDPAPTAGTIYPVIITPYPSFGCEDTLYAEITTSLKPPSNAGSDKLACSKQESQIGGAATPGYSYSWIPANLLRNPGSSNPFVLPNLPGPSDFIVKTTDLLTGCFSQDTVTITPFRVDTASSSTGKMIFCPGETSTASLMVSNPSVTVQWYQNNTVISGATSAAYQPNPIKTVSYWARLTQNGCIDSTRLHPFTFLPLPKVSFDVNRDIQCINVPVSFTNSSTFDGNEPLRFLWKFSDGTSWDTRDVIKTFTSTGDVMVKLIASSASNCSDSTQKLLFVMADCTSYLPSAFTPNGDGLNDVLKPRLAGIKALKRFTVYDRHGVIVFNTSREETGWDGKYKGMMLNTGVFAWIIEFTNNDDQTVFQKGTITLIR